MPKNDNTQTQMDLHMGKTPAIDSNYQIDDISFRMNVLAKTAAYTCLPSESGSLFTNGAATASVTFTLPAVADNSGLIYWFMNLVDSEMVISAPANTMAGHDDATSTTCTWTENSEQIGCGNMVFCDGTYWYNCVFPGLVAATVVFA